MIKEPPADFRTLRDEPLEADLTVVGGGFAGTCCAITAARQGLRVVLVQDRPVLGGNASSEVRLWVLGATAHMGNNNRWAREGGVLDELLVENMWRNPEGNPLIVDSILLEAVDAEPNLTLLLNTAAFELEKSDADTIAAVRAFCSQNSTMYTVRSPLFCDASGDGILGFLAGAAFRMGAETADEFNEPFAPDEAFGELLGHSLYFYTKDAGQPVRFQPPSFAYDNIPGRIPRFRNFSASSNGCQLWWIEHGGRLDTVHDTEDIKWELWRLVYGVWDYIKNSGTFPEAENLTLEWVGHIPGKRESRRFEGDYMLSQSDLVEQRQHRDAVSFGGWSFDLHPADGVYSPGPGSTHWHARGTYQIPYRCLYSRNITNLFLAGRIISASHVAFGSTRVIGTCSHSAQAVGVAAALCRRHEVLPAALSSGDYTTELQRELLRTGQHVPGVPLQDEEDLAQRAVATASSEFVLARLAPDGPRLRLAKSWGMWVPIPAGEAPQIVCIVDADEDTDLTWEIYGTERAGNFTPDRRLNARTVALHAAPWQAIVAPVGEASDEDRYVLFCIRHNAAVQVHTTQRRVSGLLAVRNRPRPDGTPGAQMPPPEIGMDTFEFWPPERRPEGHNLAISLEPAIAPFGPAQVQTGEFRPTTRSNAWLADPADELPTLTLTWDEPQAIARVELHFDVDPDHAMESVLRGHPERAMPFCVRTYTLRDADGEVLHVCEDNHQGRNTIRFATPVSTSAIALEVSATHGAPAAVCGLRVYRE